MSIPELVGKVQDTPFFLLNTLVGVEVTEMSREEYPLFSREETRPTDTCTGEPYVAPQRSGFCCTADHPPWSGLGVDVCGVKKFNLFHSV